MNNNENKKTENKINLKKVIIIAFTAVTCIILSAVYYESTKYQSTDDAYIESDLIKIAPRVSGQIEEVYIKDNEKIKEGDLIAKIDDTDYKVKLAQAQALYEKALYSQKVAKAKLNAINSEISVAKKDLERYTSLYKAGAVSKQKLDTAQAKYDSVKAKLLSAQEDILSSTNDKVADANLRALNAQKEQAELYLKYTNIISPNTGTVTNKNVEKGQYVQIGQPLFTLVTDDLWVEANFKENQVGLMKVGQEVEIKIDAYPKKKFKGKIESIQKASGAKSSLFPPENAVGSFVKIVQRIPVKIVFTEEINSEEYNIAAGMSVVPKVKVK